MREHNLGVLTNSREEYESIRLECEDQKYTGTGMEVYPTSYPVCALLDTGSKCLSWHRDSTIFDNVVPFEEWKGDNLSSPEQPIKHDNSKPRTDLLDPTALLEIGAALKYGAGKYSDYNYREGGGIEWHRPYGAVLRHLLYWWGGEDKDPESGLHHLAHAGAGIVMLLWSVRNTPGRDDRWQNK